MKRRVFFLTLFLLPLFLLGACIPVSGEHEPGTPIIPTLVVQPVDTAVPVTPTPLLSVTAVPPTPVTATAAETAVVIPNPNPVNQDPIVITNDATNVRHGPGLAYKVSHILSAGTTAPILGRNNAGDWWAVPGPVDGPGPVGWISGAVVVVHGDVSAVPILPAPPPTPDIPVMGNSGPPDVNVCTVAHPGPGDIGPRYVYEGPDKQTFPVVAQLGLDHWVMVIGRDNDWYHVQDMAGLTGWIPVAEVAHNGLCQPDDGPGSVPLIEDPGLPPADRCIANRPGQFPPPDVHLGPGQQFALIARLGNWAEVLQSEVGWHQIVLGPGDVGWVHDEDINLSGPCAISSPPEST